MLWANVAFAAAWLMWNGISSMSSDHVGKNIYNPDPYPIQRFHTLTENPKESYLELIEGIRAMLTDDQLDLVFGMPRLADQDSVASNRRFLRVELNNSNDNTVTVVLDTTRLYLVGFRGRTEFRYFTDHAQGVDTLFPDLPHRPLTFLSSYGELEREARRNREQIPLGLAPLEQAIIDLEESESRTSTELARSLIVIIQMFPEAIRFRYIANFVGYIIGGGQRAGPEPTATMLDLETSWGAFSQRIQHSVGGTLNPSVIITGVEEPISTVTGRLLTNIIGILYFVCNQPPNANQLISLISTSTPLHIDDGGVTSTNISEPIIHLPVIEKGAGGHMEAAGGDSCKNIGEPTVRIVGRNGLCADVKGGYFNNGDPIILWPCKSNEDANQLWTLKADGTIRSNGKCLTTYQNPVPGNYIMIFDCFGTTQDATKWDIWDNGTIINPKSSLVMSTWSAGNPGTELALQKNVYSTSQGWLVANNTQPTVTPIMNDRDDMCFIALDSVHTIYYSKCQSGDRQQSFAVYPDGSIRPDQTRDDCLTADTSNSVVSAAECNGGAKQRWSFNRDYTITNLDTSLAMDMNAEYGVVSLSPVQVQPRETQEWHAWFL